MKRTFVKDKMDELKTLIKLGGRRSEPRIVERIAGDKAETLAQYKRDKGFEPNVIPTMDALRFPVDCFQMEQILMGANVKAIEWQYKWNAGKDVREAITWKLPTEFKNTSYRTLLQYCGSNKSKTTMVLKELLQKFQTFMNTEEVAKRVNAGTLSIEGLRFVTNSGTVYMAKVFTPKKTEGKSDNAGATIGVFGRVGRKPMGPIRLELMSMSYEENGAVVVNLIPKELTRDEDLKTWRAIKQDMGLPDDQFKVCEPKRRKYVTIQPTCDPHMAAEL